MRWVTNSACAIARLVMPVAAVSATRSSLAVSVSRPVRAARRGRTPVAASSVRARSASGVAPQACAPAPATAGLRRGPGGGVPRRRDRRARAPARVGRWSRRACRPPSASALRRPKDFGTSRGRSALGRWGESPTTAVRRPNSFLKRLAGSRDEESAPRRPEPRSVHSGLRNMTVRADNAVRPIWP